MVKISFKKMTRDDVSFLNETRNLVAEKYLHDSRKFSLEDSLSWFDNFNPDYWMIYADEDAVGYFRLSNRSKENSNIYIGADIHPKFQGKGYAFLAYKVFIPFLFSEYSLHKISLEVLGDNTRAIRLYEKLGFVYEGTKRDEVLKQNTYVNSNIMSILNHEWK
jgi:RimJ/RimL family protein N-acetyltransferase